MSTETKVTVQSVNDLVIALTERVAVLEKTITELSTKKSDASHREMTDDDAKRIMTGDLKEKVHKDAAKELNLSYGQVYSCRLGFTFKSVHKAMKDAGEKNLWIK